MVKMFSLRFGWDERSAIFPKDQRASEPRRSSVCRPGKNKDEEYPWGYLEYLCSVMDVHMVNKVRKSKNSFDLLAICSIRRCMSYTSLTPPPLSLQDVHAFYVVQLSLNIPPTPNFDRWRVNWTGIDRRTRGRTDGEVSFVGATLPKNGGLVYFYLNGICIVKNVLDFENGG